MTRLTRTLHIKGMSCGGCASKIEETLSNLAGIVNVAVSLHTSQANIDYDEDLIDITTITKEITALGYQVEKKTQEKPQVSPKFTFASLWFVVKSLAIIGSLAILYDKTIGFDSLMLVSQDMSFGMVFVVGLITSIHCVTMCGGISLSLAMQKNKEETTWYQKLLPSLQYQLGRLTSYTLIGAVVGALGSVVSFSSAGKALLSLIAGIFMIAMALRMLGIADRLTAILYRLLPSLPDVTKKWMRKQKRGKAPYFVGLINGFMPCGPLQAMQIYALQTGSWFYGGLSMLLFSLGTIPLMLAFGALGTIKNKNVTNTIYRFGALVVLVLGITMTNRSLLLRGIDVAGTMQRAIGITQDDSVMAKQNGATQEVFMDLEAGTYPTLRVVAQMPTKWIIEATDETHNGCNNEIVIPSLNITIPLEIGTNEIELPPLSSGTYVYTCWMGMITGTIIVL